MTTIWYDIESRKMSLRVVLHQIEWVVWPDVQWYYTKTQQPQNFVAVAINDKLSFDKHIFDICKTANQKLNALRTINHYMKQNQDEILLSSPTISHPDY